MPPKSAKVEKLAFLAVCAAGDTKNIHALFAQTTPDLYAEGLRLFLDFLEKNPPGKSNFAAIRDYRTVLKLFATRLELYSWDFIAAHIKKLHKNYIPAAKTLFRSFLKPALILYALIQTKKAACARFPVSTVQELSVKKVEDFLSDRHTLMIHYPLLRLFYRSKKTGLVKHTVDLGRQHIALKANLPAVTAGNAATAALTFMLKVSRPGQTTKQYIEVTLPIFIPTNASLDNLALHFDDLASPTRSYAPYVKLKILYDQGLQFFKVTEKQHGHHPEYNNLAKPRAADSIKHSEQALALYLYEEAHVQALVNQLVLKLHQLGNSVRASDAIKVIAVALHFHSSKTPCAVCETVLTGLMDRENGAFLQRLKDVLSKSQNIFKFRTPKTGVRLHVLYSADDIDADHKENRHEYVANITQYPMRAKSGIVFCSLFKNGRTLNYSGVVAAGFTPDYTVLSSGGTSSEKTRGTNRKINSAHVDTMSDLVTRHKEFQELIEREALAKALEKYDEFCPWLFETLGVQIQPILGDGNCQFVAIAVQLLQVYPGGDWPPAVRAKIGDFAALEQLAQRLRALTEVYLCDHRNEFEHLIGAEDFPKNWAGKTDFDTYLNYIKGDQAWGGEHTLRALANILQRPMFVLHPDIMQGSIHIENRIYLPTGKSLDDFEYDELLVLSYNGMSHYDTITDRPTQQLIELISPNSCLQNTR